MTRGEAAKIVGDIVVGVLADGQATFTALDRNMLVDRISKVLTLRLEIEVAVTRIAEMETTIYNILAGTD